MKKILEMLMKYENKKQGDFLSTLTPGIDRKYFIGVKNPECRLIAKQIVGTDDANKFLKELPHKYLDENMLHGFIISYTKDYNVAIQLIEDFLPYIDNWAVCDSTSPKCFSKNKKDLMKHIKIWIKSKHIYTIRFGIEMLMSHFLDEDFDPLILKMVSQIRSKEYYVNMMIAWFFATALAKQYDATIPFIKQQSLDDWTHNKTIQKAIESFRITNEQKDFLRKLKVIKK